MRQRPRPTSATLIHVAAISVGRLTVHTRLRITLKAARRATAHEGPDGCDMMRMGYRKRSKSTTNSHRGFPSGQVRCLTRPALRSGLIERGVCHAPVLITGERATAIARFARSPDPPAAQGGAQAACRLLQQENVCLDVSITLITRSGSRLRSCPGPCACYTLAMRRVVLVTRSCSMRKAPSARAAAECGLAMFSWHSASRLEPIRQIGQRCCVINE